MSFALSLVAASQVAHADETRIGGRVELLPSGSLTRAAGPDQEVRDTGLAFGIGPTIDRETRRHVFFGFAPKLLFRVKGDGDEGSAAELDLFTRVQFHFQVAGPLRIYPYLSCGYSFVFLGPDDGENTADGFIGGAGLGALYDVSHRLFVTGEVGLQFGFQEYKVDGDGMKHEASTNFLHLTVGVGTTFGKPARKMKIVRIIEGQEPP